MDNQTHHIPPPCSEEVGILYADEHLLVTIKPSGLLSVPGRIVKDCLLYRVQKDYPMARIVHRLDLDTSGLLVLGLSQLAIVELNRQFRERTISKRYVAEVFGRMQQDSGEVLLPLSPDPVNRPRQLIDHVGGKACETRYAVLSRQPQSTMVALFPVTGRSHQLRIHMSEIGHPILGCDLYAHEAAYRAASRLQLHAEELELRHPATGERVTFFSQAPFTSPDTGALM